MLKQQQWDESERKYMRSKRNEIQGRKDGGSTVYKY